MESCLNCSTPLKKHQKKFCSKACFGISQHGKIVSSDTRFRLRESHIGKKFTESHKKNMSLALAKSKNPKWIGGRVIQAGTGYVLVKAWDHPSSYNHGYVREHRLVVEKALGRYLTRTEVVHHLGEKTDNRPHMLMAFKDNSAHKRFHDNPSLVKSSEIVFDGRGIKH